MSDKEEKKRALIISISNYENLENLDFCKNDGEIMYDTLTGLGYEIPYGKKLIGTVPDIEVKKAIVDFFRTTSNDASDTLLFYYSGHGVLDGYEGRYFATSNINSQIPEENGIAFEFLTQQMDRSTSRRTIAVIDCCFSGSAVPGVTGKGANAEIEAEKLGREALSKQFKNSKGKCVLASSLSQRRSYNLPDKKMSAFTHFIVKGLKGSKASVDKDGYVTPEKLDEYVFSELSKFKDLAQTPVRNLSISGRLALAYYPNLAQTEQSQKENQENSNYGFWTDVKNRITGAYDEIIKHPTIDDFSKSAIESIPVVGVLFVKIYENSTLNEEEKTSHVLEIFKYANNLDEEKLENFCRLLQKHRSEIVNDTDILVQLASNPKHLVDYQKTNSSSVTASSNIPITASTVYDEGVSLIMAKKYEDAARKFDEVIKLDPDFIDAVRFKGRALAALNRHKAALFYFDKVLQKTPNDIVVLFLEGNSLLSIGDRKGAVDCYEDILKIQPENKMAIQKLQEVKHTKRKFGLKTPFRK